MTPRTPDRTDFAILESLMEHGSLSAAARARGVAQSTLTRQLRSLEKRVGLQLVERSALGSQLTAAGVLLHEALTRVHDDLAEAMSQARVARDPDAPTIVVGVPQDQRLRDALHQVFVETSRLHIGLRTLTRVLPFLRQREAVRRGTVDVGFGIEPVSPGDDGLVGEPILETTLDHLLVPAWHAVAQLTQVDLSDLDGETVGIPDPALAPGFHQQMNAALDAARFTGKREVMPHELTRLAQDVARGTRLAVGSLPGGPSMPGVVGVPLTHPLVTVRDYVYTRPRPAAVVRHLVQSLRAALPNVA